MKRIGVLAAAMLLWSCPGVLADGMMAPRVIEGRSTPMVASPRQEALLVTDGARVQVTLRTYFKAGPDELVWIIPVPAKPDKIDKADQRVFDMLEETTAPRFYETREGSTGDHLSCGCGGSQTAALEAPTVTVEAHGTAGIFDYTVLSATDAADLVKWLDDNQYQVPGGAQGVLGRYVRDKWHWLAIKVRAEEAGRRTLAAHPITYTYRDTRLVYPLAISQLSADLESEIVLYVLAPARCACANWTNGHVVASRVRASGGSASGTNYEELFRYDTLAAGGRMFFTEYYSNSSLDANLVGVMGRYASGDIMKALGHCAHLTRLRALVGAGQMDRDVSLLPIQPVEGVTNVYRVSFAASSQRSVTAIALPLSCLGLLLMGTFLTRRSGPARGAGMARGAGLTMIALACAAFTMM